MRVPQVLLSLRSSVVSFVSGWNSGIFTSQKSLFESEADLCYGDDPATFMPHDLAPEPLRFLESLAIRPYCRWRSPHRSLPGLRQVAAQLENARVQAPIGTVLLAVNSNRWQRFPELRPAGTGDPSTVDVKRREVLELAEVLQAGVRHLGTEKDERG